MATRTSWVTMVLWSTLICMLLLVHSTEGAKGKQNYVTTLLDAKWKATPVILEVSEYLADESNEYFWAFVNLMAEQDIDALKSKTDKDYHDYLITETNKFISPPKMALLKLSLSLHIYSPKVEMFHQISLDKRLPEDCLVVVEINGMFSCDIAKLDFLVETAQERNKSDIYKVDHYYPGKGGSSVVAILYGELGTEEFKHFHQVLKREAEMGTVDYIVRHYLKKRPNKRTRLSGYGVELAIKNTEYKAQDDAKVRDDEDTGTDQDGDDRRDSDIEGFIFSQLKELYPEKKKKLEEFKDHLLESADEMAPMKVWQVQELSLQAAQRIRSTSVDEALRLLRDISQNFPVQARSLVKTVVKDELKKEILKNQNAFAQNHNIAPSDSALFINGIQFDMEISDIFSILEVVREEQQVMDGLHSLGVNDSQLSTMMALDFQLVKQDYAVDIRDSAIQYVNDLEIDKRYSNWASSIMDILRPTYPGLLRSIRKNMYHLIFVLDPSTEESKDLLKLAESFYIHNAPIRIGLLFMLDRDMEVDGFSNAGVAMLNAFNFVAQEKNQQYAGLSFITDVYAHVGEKTVDPKDVMDVFKQKYPGEDLELIFGQDSDYDTGRKLAWDFMDRTGLPQPPLVLMNGVPLESDALNADLFEEAVLTEVMHQTQVIQKAVYKNELSDFQNVLDYLMSKPNVMPRLNEQILSGKGDVMDLTGIPILPPTYEKFSNLTSKVMTGTLIPQMKYLTARDDFNFRPITHWIVCDLETPEGRALLSEALEQVKASNEIRVAVIFNSKDTTTAENYQITKAVHIALETLDKTASKYIVGRLVQPENANDILEGRKLVSDFVPKGVEKEAFEKAVQQESGEILKIHRLYCDRVLHMKPGNRAVITNGRIIGPLGPTEAFIVDDFNLLEKFSLNLYGEKLRVAFQDINDQGEEDSISDLAMRVTALLLSRKANKVRHEVMFHSSNYSVVKIPARLPGQPSFDIKAIVDPVSRGAQKMAPLLMVLQEVINARIWVFLNSEDKVSDLPLKSFYRLVLEPELQFLADGSASPGPVAKFGNMPSAPLFTQRLDTPDNWLVEVMRSPYDLDNIHLEDVPVDGGVHSEFELEHLILEGHCFEMNTGNPPRGLQFTLGTHSNPVMVDTIVMANLGYFQLKSSPGAWLLRLRQGRSAEIYDIVSHDYTDSPPGTEDVQIVISSFKSHIVKLKVTKKVDKQRADLLSEDEDQSGIWNSITSSFVGNGGKKEDDEEDDKINIFSVASGHLYERLLRIMMVSVLKHTKTPVKFWFLKNYLSPTMKDFLPHMAKEYGFEYELVQYQWPRWLHQQTEKQRTIWGYKILFLDVLFPLDVKKFIFVDADQIVRTDLKELRDLDLGGAPYGYTPFCESRKEMDGYRFWKTGYWSHHLQGRRYHISALYVVDLKKFRRIAAGDRLRGQYQGLSQDPNSLSNLDQDLPNNMIHQVAIKSLPQEWMWCETWCDDGSKAQAKTIDLCNNPRTKEPKLAAAVRIVPEWKDYDTQITNLQNRIRKGSSVAGQEIDSSSHQKTHEEL